MFLMYGIEGMNYEALGRYTEAKEKAQKLAISLHNTMASLHRLLSTSAGTSQMGEAKEFDFPAIKMSIADAESSYSEMLAAIGAANHEAPQCEREAIKIRKW